MEVRTEDIEEAKRGGVSIQEAVACIETLSRFDIDEFERKDLISAFGMGFFIIADVSNMNKNVDQSVIDELEHRFTSEAKKKFEEAGEEYDAKRTRAISIMSTEMLSPVLAPFALKRVQHLIRGLMLQGHTKCLKAIFDELDLTNSKIKL